MFLFAPEALAQEEQLEMVGQAAGLPETDIRVVVATIIRYAIGLIGIIFLALIVYAGYLWMTSAGDPEKVKKAKMIMRNAVIGAFIVLASYSIVSFILNALLGQGGIFGGFGSEPPVGVEPLSGSLGAGIIQDHWPLRNANDIPRNTKIIITFKEPIALESLTNGVYSDNGTPGDETDDTYFLNDGLVLIYPNSEGEGSALTSEAVLVNRTADNLSWVFDPVELLGSAIDPMNYTVDLEDGILKEDGTEAFSGSYNGGYEWTFEVSTEVDLEPPYVQSVYPGHATEKDRNVVVQINFNEAMDPTAVSGTNNGVDSFFSNVLVEFQDPFNSGTVTGTWTISNGYRTVEFVSDDACAEDPCGDTIYCLPGESVINTTVKAATVGDSAPEAVGYPYDGAVDVTGNSLDGGNNNHNPDVGASTNLDGVADGPTTDNYVWAFETTNDVNDVIPSIYELRPDLEAEEVELDAEISATFTEDDGVSPPGPGVTLMSSTLNSSSIGLVPVSSDFTTHELSYRIEKVDLYEGYSETPPQADAEPTATQVVIDHGLFLESTDTLTWYYEPWLSQDVKSSYQICYYPAHGPGSANPSQDNIPPDCDVDSSNPSCCRGDAEVSRGGDCSVIPE